MPALAIPQTGLSLGSSQSCAEPDLAHPDMFSLNFSDSVIEDMIKCVRNGKNIQLCLGNEPKITYGPKTLQLSTTEDPFPCEFFRSITSPSRDTKMFQPNYMTTFLARASTSKFIPKIRTVIVPAGRTIAARDSTVASPAVIREDCPLAGVDEALANLKSSLASADARKKDNTTKLVKDSSLPPAVQKKGSAQPLKAGNKSRFLAQNKKSLGRDTASSMPTSPALNSVGSPSLAPTSVPLSQQQAEKAKGIRRPIIHALALGPATRDHLIKSKNPTITEAEFKVALEKVADLEDGKYKLKNKSFRELDVFNYNYTPEERKVAIDNAVRAFDRLRLNSSEPEWEKLLPFEERGTGKSLSKLQAKIANGPIQPVKAPRIKLQGADDLFGENVGEENGDMGPIGEKLSTTVPKSGETMTRSYSNPPITKTKKVSEKEAHAKRLLARPGKAPKPAATKSDEKAERESTKVKSSRFVSESDEEDSYLVPPTSKDPVATSVASKTKASPATAPAPVPKTNTKRQRDNADQLDDTARASKKPCPSTSPQKSSPLASSPPTNASDFDDSSSSPRQNGLKRKATQSSSDIPVSKRHHKSSSNSTSSSVGSNSSVAGSEVGSAAWNVSLKQKEESANRTKRFNAFYAQYLKLHRQLSLTATEKRDVDKIADLQDMHERLVTMKAEIIACSKN